MSRMNPETIPAIVTNRRQKTTRRRAIGTAARVTAATGLALVAAAAQGDRGIAAQASAGDVERVTQLLAAEKVAYALIRDGLTQFTSEKTTSGDRLQPTQPTLVRLAHHDGAHFSVLSTAIADLGEEITLESPPEFAFASFTDFLRRVAELKQQHVAAYVLAVSTLDDKALRALASRILAVEARHAAYLNARIGEAPFWNELEDVGAVANPLVLNAAEIG